MTFDYHHVAVILNDLSDEILPPWAQPFPQRSPHLMVSLFPATKDSGLQRGWMLTNLGCWVWVVRRVIIALSSWGQLFWNDNDEYSFGNVKFEVIMSYAQKCAHISVCCATATGICSRLIISAAGSNCYVNAYSVLTIILLIPLCF